MGHPITFPCWRGAEKSKNNPYKMAAEYFGITLSQSCNLFHPSRIGTLADVGKELLAMPVTIHEEGLIDAI